MIMSWHVLAQASGDFAAQAVEDVNRQTGANVDPNADPGDMLQSNTRGLMAAMSTLPELTERKKTIDKHTALLGSIVKVSALVHGWIIGELAPSLVFSPVLKSCSSALLPELQLEVVVYLLQLSAPALRALPWPETLS